MTLPFDRYDKRNYPVSTVEEGYQEWSATYDDDADDELDLQLLEKLTTINWEKRARAFDLGCGTGRIGCWLKEKEIFRIDGVDISKAMIDIAASKSVYTTLKQSDITSTNLESNTYDLGLCVLVACHISNLFSIYREAVKLLNVNGMFILLDYHPFMLLNGIPTHYETEIGKRSIENYIHLLSDHIRAATSEGMVLVEMEERLMDNKWGKFPRHIGQPMSFALVWKKHNHFLQRITKSAR